MPRAAASGASHTSAVLSNRFRLVKIKDQRGTSPIAAFDATTDTNATIHMSDASRPTNTKVRYVVTGPTLELLIEVSPNGGDQTQFHFLGLGLHDLAEYQLIAAERWSGINSLLCSPSPVLFHRLLIYLFKLSSTDPCLPCTPSAVSRLF